MRDPTLAGGEGDQVAPVEFVAEVAPGHRSGSVRRCTPAAGGGGTEHDADQLNAIHQLTNRACDWHSSIASTLACGIELAVSTR